MVTAQLAVDGRGVDGLPDRNGHRRFMRAVVFATGTVALGIVAALVAGGFENRLLQSPAVPGASIGVALPADLFTAPRPPLPRIMVRYAAPRPAPSAPVAPAPATAAPAAVPSSSPRSHPSPSPSPTWGGDN